MATTEIGWEALYRGMAQLCEDRGWHHGVPIPSSIDPKHRIILAPGCPLSDKHIPGIPFAFVHEDGARVCSVREVEDSTYLVNRWERPAERISIYRDEKGYFKFRETNRCERMRILLDTMTVRYGAMSADSEVTAMRKLQPMLKEGQWDSYVLNGCFPETSKRSGVTYILRKGLPTIAMRETKVEDGVKRIFLAALCLHGLAYYEDTFAGSYPPTDEVINHLLYIRADERKFWAKSGQHTIDDPRAGI